MKQSSLYFNRQFLPLFVTQWLNAFNDNVFKNALILVIAFEHYTLYTLNSKQVISLGSFLFTLPYLLFSPIAGQLADNLSKSKLISYIKFLEIIIMGCTFIGFIYHQIGFLLLLLFLMGSQSALFGPAKLGALPELVGKKRLLEANGNFNTGTFIAILLGTAVGGILIKFFKDQIVIVPAALFVIAILGFLSTFTIPKLPSATNKRPLLKLNIPASILQNIQLALRFQHIGRAVFYTSWLWFAGNVYLLIIPFIVRDYIKLEEGYATILLATFSIGIAIGSIFVPWFGKKFGMKRCSVIGLWGMASTNLLTIFLLAIATPDIKLIPYLFIANFFILAMTAALFFVPLQTYVQAQSDSTLTAQMIGAQNIIQSIAILFSSFILFFLFEVHTSLEIIMAILTLLNVCLLYYFRTHSPYDSKSHTELFTPSHQPG